uniref:Rib_recp_KP_reg domain-containing protein n=1 Tax=Strongyloides stercoralis TaxID=6248 RepID=A0A0K0ECU6_STRER
MFKILLVIPLFLIVAVVLLYLKINKKSNESTKDSFKKLDDFLQEETKKEKKKNVVVKPKKIKPKKAEKKEGTKEESKSIVSPLTPIVVKEESSVKINTNKKNDKKNKSNEVTPSIPDTPVVEKASVVKSTNVTGNSNKKTKKVTNTEVKNVETKIVEKPIHKVEASPVVEKEKSRSKRSIEISMNDVNDAFNFLISVDGIPEKCIFLITDELDKLRSSVVSCNTKIASIEKQLKEKDLTINKLKETTKKEPENPKILEKLAAKDAVIGNLKAQLSDFEEKYNILDDICRTRLTANAGNDTEINSLKTKISTLEKERDYLRSQVESAKNEFGKLNNDYINSVNAFKAQLDNCNHEINRLHTEFSLATEKGKNFERMYIEAEHAKARLVNEVQIVTNEYNQTESQVKELQAKLNTFMSKENENLQKSANEAESIKAQFENYKNETEKIKAGFETTLNEMKNAIGTLEMELNENKKENERLRNSLNEQDNLQEKINSLTETIQKHKENHSQIAEFSEKAKELKIKLQNDIAAKDQETSRLKDLNKELIIKNINQAKELQEIKNEISLLKEKDNTSKNSEKELAEASRRFNEVVKINENIVDAVKKAEENCQKAIAKTEAEAEASLKCIFDTTFDVLSKHNKSISKTPKSFEPTSYKNWLVKSIESIHPPKKDVVEKIVIKEVPSSNVSNAEELEKTNEIYKSTLLKLEKKLIDIERDIINFEQHQEETKKKNEYSSQKHSKPCTKANDCKLSKSEESDYSVVDVKKNIVQQKSQEIINGDEWEVVE